MRWMHSFGMWTASALIHKLRLITNLAFVRKALKLRLSIYYDESPENIEIRRVKSSYGLGPPFVCINGRARGD